MKSEIDTYKKFAKVYDLLREVFFNEWKETTINSLKEKADKLPNEFKNNLFISLLSKLEKKDIDEVRWEYNRLFIGPQKPLAIPFESPYRSDKNLLMQKFTYEVREYYSMLGLEVKDLNHFPDDYIGFEFQYLYFISLLIANTKEKDMNLYDLINLRTSFLQNHPLEWFDKFCKAIIDNSRIELWKELAFFIKELMNQEVLNKAS